MAVRLVVKSKTGFITRRTPAPANIPSLRLLPHLSTLAQCFGCDRCVSRVLLRCRATIGNGLGAAWAEDRNRR